MYEHIEVWTRIASKLARRYRCFRLLESGSYCVQSADFIRLPLNQSHLAQLDCQFFELLIEEPPEQRSAVFSSLEAAIAAFDRAFDDR